MSRIKITCKAPPAPQTQPGEYPTCNTFLPSWPDVHVTFTDNEGNTHELEDYCSITWRCVAGVEPAIATIEMYADVELEAEVDEKA